MKEKLSPKKYCTLGLVFLSAWSCASALRAETLTEDDIRWREKIGFNPQVHGPVSNSSDADVFARLPYAYYPYANELEVVFDAKVALKLMPEGAAKPSGEVNALKVSVFPAVIEPELLKEMPFFFAAAPQGPVDSNKEVASGTIALDGNGRGHGVIKLPDLPTGNYRVEYEFGGAKLTAAKTFRRSHFEWENCNYGKEHKVYAPFTPVKVDGNKVSMVDRTYTVNALGLFDSVVSQGRELLAEPMKLMVETEDGQTVEWKSAGRSGKGVSGKVLYPDLAEFQTSAKSTIGNLKSQVSVEEDGCAKVQWTLSPAKDPAKVKRMWLEIALKESEAPLCHMVGMSSMRHNYAGKVPRGGKITWIQQAWRPSRFEVEPFAGEAPVSYQVWEARQQMNWDVHDPTKQWNFAPYIWLGAEERGLAWFGDHTEGYVTDGKSSIQRLFIEPGKVVLRVELIQQPVTLDTPRTFEFGLQASPTKPMRADWRGYEVPGGGGMSVVVWGGFNCADKVPANKDWTIVDKIMEGRQTGKADLAWFAEYAKTHSTIIVEGGGAKPGVLKSVPLEQAEANGQPWLTALSHFVGKTAGEPKDLGTTVYFEEHQTSGRYPEVAEFMDEWSDGTFARYRYFDQPKTWGPEIRSANPASYRDFAVFYANEWMKRGVGIYYDNTYPMLDYNRQHFGGRDIDWSSSIWGHRDYYKRVWKRSRELMETKATPLPLHTVGHVTNCQVLPFTTWWDATLGVESPGHWQPEGTDSAEWRAAALAKSEWPFIILPTPKKDAAGKALPYPPDYLRAMECGRMAGLIPHYRHSLRSDDAFGGIGISYGATEEGKDPKVREHRYMSDAAMGLVHEARGGQVGISDNLKIGALRRAIKGFGYGSPRVTVHNYWAEKPFVTVGNSAVKWIAMTREEEAPFGLLLLQSYSPDAISTTVGFPEGKIFVDADTREELKVGSDGKVQVALSPDYGTRLLYVLRSANEPKLLPTTPETVMVDDFELDMGYLLNVRGKGIEVLKDKTNPSNHVLRIEPGHPSQNKLRSQGMTLPAEGELSLKFRISELPEAVGACGLLHIGYRENKDRRYYLGLGVDLSKDGIAKWTLVSPLLALDGGKNEGFQSVISVAEPVAAVDTGWHTLAIRLKGKNQQILLDGEKVFEGEDDRLEEGGFTIAPGWGWKPPMKYVEIDDLRVSR